MKNDLVLASIKYFEECSQALHTYEKNLAANIPLPPSHPADNAELLNTSVDAFLLSIYTSYQTKAEALFEEYVEGNNTVSKATANSAQKQQNELQHYYHLRDTAFFNVMRAIKQQDDSEDQSESPIVQDIALSPLLMSTLELITPYCVFEKQQKALIKQIEQQIASELTLQKTWQEFLIECLSPFILKFFNYESVQERIKKRVNQLTQQYHNETEALALCKDALCQKYEATYHANLPEDTQHLYNQLLEKSLFINATIDALADEKLKTDYERYLKQPSMANLLTCYKFICRGENTSQNPSETALLSQLKVLFQDLHPDMSTLLGEKNAQSIAEHHFVETLKTNCTNTQGLNQHYFYVLYSLYIDFLIVDSHSNILKLYQHITEPILFKRSSLLTRLLAHLQQYYPETFKNVVSTPIARLDENICTQLLEKHMPSTDPASVHTKALKLLANPTWDNVFELENSLLHNKAYYAKDGRVTALLEELMRMCVIQLQSDRISAEEAIIEPNVSHTPELAMTIHQQPSLEPISYAQDSHIPALFNGSIESEKTFFYEKMMQLSAQFIEEPSQAVSILRNEAFFAHQTAIQLQQYQKDYLPTNLLTDYSSFHVAFTPIDQTIPIISTLQRLENYLSLKKELTEALGLIDLQLEGDNKHKPAQQSQRSFIFQLILFMSQPFIYIPIQIQHLFKHSPILEQESRQLLIKKHNQLKNHLYLSKDKFEIKWKDIYQSLISDPELEKERLEALYNDIGKNIETYSHSELSRHFQIFLTSPSQNALKALCQQLIICRHANPSNDIPTGILSTLHELYPDQATLITETTKEMAHKLDLNDKLYRLATHIQHHPEPKVAKLYIKLRHFLNIKSEYHFAVLHQQLTTPPCATLTEAKEILDILVQLYPDISTKIAKQQQNIFVHLPTKLWGKFYPYFHDYPSNHPVFLALKKLMSRSHWQHLTELNDALINHPNYIHDHILSKFVFMMMQSLMMKPQQYNNIRGFFNQAPEQPYSHILRQYRHDPTAANEISHATIIKKFNTRCQDQIERYTASQENHTTVQSSNTWPTFLNVAALIEQYKDDLGDNPFSAQTTEHLQGEKLAQYFRQSYKLLRFDLENDRALQALFSNINDCMDQLDNGPLKSAAFFMIECLEKTAEYQTYLNGPTKFYSQDLR